MLQTIKDTFDTAVHNNFSLNKIQKFNYLREQLHNASRPLLDYPN